jgi:hypothetical protein
MHVKWNSYSEKVSGCNKDGVYEQFLMLYNKEIRDSYRSPCILTIMKFMRLQWAGHMARMGKI